MRIVYLGGKMKLILFVYTHTESEYTAPAAAGKYRQKPTEPG